MYTFRRELDTDSARVRSLYGDDFMNDPLRMLALVTEFFALSADTETLEEITSGSAFNADSKISGRSFDKEAHTKRKKQLAEDLSGEIDQGLAFLQEITRSNPIPGRLPLAIQ